MPWMDGTDLNIVLRLDQTTQRWWSPYYVGGKRYEVTDIRCLENGGFIVCVDPVKDDDLQKSDEST